MSTPDFMMIWPENTAMSAVIWLIALVGLAYIARHPAHGLILSVSRMLHYAMRLAAGSVNLAERKLSERNREVLLAAGREAEERMIEREFERVDATVRREIAEYPALHRSLNETAGKIDEDYTQSTNVPPSPPGWVKAVDAVAKIPAKGDPMVGHILESIHVSMVKAEKQALDEYRKASGKRHTLLKGMMPHWRKLLQGLKQFDKNANSLIERSRVIDRHMDEYEQIVQGTDRAHRMLSSSSLTQFFIAAFVLAIAIGGAMINFNLIARPMAEMVGGSSMIMGYKTASIAALVIILVEVAMGLFLMECLRITRLFPVIGALNDKMRVRMIWITFSILLMLASVEAGLAYMREILAQDDAALRASLLSGLTGEMNAANRWITTAAQMGMGFILPFALVFVAIPLESFVHSSRTVLGLMGVALLRSTAFTLRLLGNITRFTGSTLVKLYDLFIFAPLWIESQFGARESKKTEAEDKGSHLRTTAMREASS
ncbi:MAG: hypothetical protein R8K46_00995 [Mariprofundaceae bacterium]